MARAGRQAGKAEKAEVKFLCLLFCLIRSFVVGSCSSEGWWGDSVQPGANAVNFDDNDAVIWWCFIAYVCMYFWLPWTHSSVKGPWRRSISRRRLGRWEIVAEHKTSHRGRRLHLSTWAEAFVNLRPRIRPLNEANNACHIQQKHVCFIDRKHVSAYVCLCMCAWQRLPSTLLLLCMVK